jgi:hypothetical protein
MITFVVYIYSLEGLLQAGNSEPKPSATPNLYVLIECIAQRVLSCGNSKPEPKPKATAKLNIYILIIYFD